MAYAVGMAQARQRPMPPHLVATRRQIADRQNPQAVDQSSRLDAERRAKILEAEDIAATDAGPAAFEPVPDLVEFAAPLAVFRVDVAQVASNGVFEHGQQQLQLALDNVIPPDQVDVLPRHQESRVDAFFVLWSFD
jgi:hypothetical protein